MVFFSLLLYYLLLIPVSLLPFSLLYGLSRFLSFVLYRLVAYRKDIVYSNLRKSFPEKSTEAINAIAGKFYVHFADVLMEGFKAFTISKKTVEKRLSCKNPELLEKYYQNGQSVVVTIGHYNSWEFFMKGIQLLIPHRAAVIYQPLSNSFFNRKIAQSRSKYGTQMLAIQDVKSYFQETPDKPRATVFAIDQSPSDSGRCYWMSFLNQETGVLYGAEKFARTYDLPVLYLRINKLRRGYYQLEFFEVEIHSAASKYGEITEKSTQLLEKDIRQHPELWLWTHRRWKHKRPEGHENREKK